MRRASVVSRVVVLALPLVAACSSSSHAPIPIDGGGDTGTLTETGGDASPEAGAACTFNRDCPSDRRCSCDTATGCFCVVGARGTGRVGVDACTSGDDCASSLCVEGPSDAGSGYVCSGECMTAADCAGALPVCDDVAGLGKICARAP